MATPRRGRWDGKPVRHRYRDALAEIDPLAFERLLADYYREAGYDVDHSGTGNGASTFDGGVDLRLRKDGRLTLVQCKRENAYQVTHNVVHELLGIKVNQGAAEAIVITTGEFTEAARKASSTGHVQLIDGVELRRLLGPRLEQLPSRHVAPPSDYVPIWEPLVLVEGLPRRRSIGSTRDKQDESGWKFIGALAVLILVAILLNCTGPRRASSTQSLRHLPTSTSAMPEAVPRQAAASYFDPRRVQPIATSAPPMDAPSPESHRLSASEQARRDEETRRYLERVPEVTHYRYSPLDQNRAPASPTPDADRQSQ